MNGITVNECYEIMKIGKIINIEDGIQFDSTMRAIVYDYLRMGESCRGYLKKELPAEIGTALSNVFDAMPQDYSWENIPDRNAEALLISDAKFSKALGYYKELEKMNIKDCQSIFQRYGIGIKKTSAVLPNLLIQERDDGRIPLRIFKDWNAEDVSLFDAEVKKSVSNKERFICIIDDQLKHEKYGEKIINHIVNELCEASEYGTYLVLSSNGSRSLAKFDDGIYIDFVEKGGTEGDKDKLADNAMNAILRSNYNMLLRIMQKRRVDAITWACHEALTKRETAVFLANMAKAEGETGYNVIEDWMSIRERFYFEKSFNDDIKTMTSLSWLLSMTDDLGYDTSQMWDDVEELQKFEQFDYSINQKLMTIQPGDVFEISSSGGNEYYVLIGQACDMMLRNKGRTKNECWLLPAFISQNHYIPKTTQKLSEGKVVVNQFCVDNVKYSLCIDCQREKLIDDLILDLCSYNLNGVAEIDLGQAEISIQKRSLITAPMVNRYKNIAEFFSLYTEKLGSDPGVREIVQKLAPSEKNKLIPIYDLKKENNVISFAIRRICRIKKYVGLLNQLHSEYMNRLGFDTMNVDCVESNSGFIQIKSEETSRETSREINPIFFQLTTDRTKNIRDRQKLKWFVDKEMFESILEDVGIDKNFFKTLLNDKYYIFDKNNIGLSSFCKYKKQYDSDAGIATLVIEVK